MLRLSLYLFILCTALLATESMKLDCYTQHSAKGKPQSYSGEVFILIDETTSLDEELKRLAIQKTKELLSENWGFSISKFSAFIQNKYSEVVAVGLMEAKMSEQAKKENDFRKTKQEQFDHCIKMQNILAAKNIDGNISKAFGQPSSSIAKSDILKSFQELSKNVVKPSKAKTKVVLIVSDMLENSSISSFYANNSVRKIDPSAEMKKVEASGLLSDFGGAKVYVLGSGITPQNAQNKNNYRDPKTMQALNEFWKLYFQKSNAKLIEFGQPALLGRVE